MKIEVVKHIPFPELEQLLRKVPLMEKDEDGNEIFVYKDAKISLKKFHPKEVNPTTFYVLRKALKFQRELRTYLMEEHGIDSLHLNEAIEIVNEDGQLWTLTPPIIEVTRRDVNYVPKEGEIPYDDNVNILIPVINDGAHRVHTALTLGETFNGILISNVMEEYPFYAHPNEWDMVKVVDEVPKTKVEKKFYSRDNCYALYRNFGILGCGAPRNLGE